MERKGLQKLLLHRIVLHKLRGQLNEIPEHIGAREALKAGVGKHAVQRMAELMQEGLNLAQGQQGGLVFCRLGEVHHHRHMRAHIFVGFTMLALLDILSLIFRHPGSALLAFARIKVGIEHSQEAAVAVEHLVSLHIRMVDGYILVFLERDAIQSVGQSEDALDDPRQFEVRSQHLCIEFVFIHLQLVGIESCVPGTHVVEQTLQLLLFLYGSRLVGIDEVVEQTIDAALVGGHAALQHIVGISFVP